MRDLSRESEGRPTLQLVAGGKGLSWLLLLLPLLRSWAVQLMQTTDAVSDGCCCPWRFAVVSFAPIYFGQAVDSRCYCSRALSSPMSFPDQRSVAFGRPWARSEVGLAGSRNPGCLPLRLEHFRLVEDRRVGWMDVERSWLVVSVGFGSVTADSVGKISIHPTDLVGRNGNLRRRNAVRVRQRQRQTQWLNQRQRPPCAAGRWGTARVIRVARPDTAFDRCDPECLKVKLENGSYGKNVSRALLGPAERSRGFP